MATTCHECRGFSFHYEESNLKRCSGCHQVTYCSTECQKIHWVKHIFDCNPSRPINTADYLALACYEGEVPTHPQTREDYGFNRTLESDEECKLISLYIGLIKRMGVPPLRIHGWRIRGVLVENIKAEYYKLPEGWMDLYFAWFLQNEHIVALAGQPLLEPQEELDAGSDAKMIRAWRFIGRSKRDTMEDINVALAHMPAEEKNSYYLYLLLLSEYPLVPDLDLWVDFGFAACTSVGEEMQLCARYERLIHKCTFKQFCDAHRAHAMLGLFRSKGLQVNETKDLRDLLGPQWKKSVWHLKQYIRQEELMPEAGARPSVMVDYGFFNCSSDSERQELRRVYKAFFDSPIGFPLALHEAAIQGNIYGYVSSVVQGLDPKFQQLMKNPYPLSEYD